MGGGMVGMYLMAGNGERQLLNSVDKVWEDDSDRLMIPDGQEDGGQVFDGRER
jgi:hypothetical protein